MNLSDTRARLAAIHAARRWTAVRSWPVEGWQVLDSVAGYLPRIYRHESSARQVARVITRRYVHRAWKQAVAA